MRNIVVLIVGTLVLSSACCPQVKSVTQEKPVFRAPFTLKLRIDGAQYYEENFVKVPYVADNDVYIFSGETFGVNVTITENQLSRITYQRNPAKADVEFKFTQVKSPNGLMMLLVIRNALKKRVLLDALMTVPGDKVVHETNVLPVGSRHSNTESWPHPIVQLVLRNFRFSDEAANPID